MQEKLTITGKKRAGKLKTLQYKLHCNRLPSFFFVWRVERCVLFLAFLPQWTYQFIHNDNVLFSSSMLQSVTFMPLVGPSCFPNIFQYRIQLFSLAVYLGKIPKNCIFKLVEVLSRRLVLIAKWQVTLLVYCHFNFVKVIIYNKMLQFINTRNVGKSKHSTLLILKLVEKFF